MPVTSLTKDSAKAIEYFEGKLAFELGPIELKYALEAKETLQIIDLRTPEAYSKGHVPGSVNISLEEIEKETSKLSKDKSSIVYCYNITCHLSTKAALALAKQGHSVRELAGGFEEWVKYELPVEGKAEVHSCSTSKGSSCG